MKNLLKADKQVFAYVATLCHVYSSRYASGLQAVFPGHRDPLCYGSCSKHGLIRIRLRWGKKNDGRRLRAWEILDTVAHELAHLIDQKHSERWFNKYAYLLHVMGSDGCYAKLKGLLK